MSIAIPFLVLLLAGAFAAYHRMRLALWAASSATLLVACWLLVASHVATIVAAVLLGLVAVPLLLPFVRKPLLTAPLLNVFRKVLPPLSQTERIALETGSVGFEGELFTGDPDWQKLLNYPKPQLSAEEQAFLDGPVEELCRMINDWEITHVHADLPPELWNFIKEHKFFGMIIPKAYGGLGFSALAHHKVIQKITSASSVVSSTVGVPNSLGPGELLVHYGSKEQKDYYLPRLAVGQEVPCFGLTGPFAGSDATSIPDYGIVCKGEWSGANVLGVKLTFDKRYITLAPVATLIGLAFRLYDPDGLIGDTQDVGITLALLPRETPGVEIGRRHFPLNSPFQNGPIHGREVFIPLSQLIGGVDMVGKGWNMLNECLAVGRSITLPSTASGGVKFGAVVTGTYARIRKQFGLSVGRFEGVEEALARIGGKAYAISALAQATAAAVDRGDVPSVPSAIAKYHCTTMSREVISDVMDVIGGKGIILGPRNFAGRAWQGAPIAITVEGANIMTRSLLIFGQGAILCHPWVMKEMKAASNPDHNAGIDAFDRSLFGHIGFALSNAVRSLWFGLTAARIGAAPGDAYTRRFFRKLDRYSANLALMADVSMLMLGGKLKFKESLSGRLGDVLSHIYMTSAMLKRYHDDGAPASDQPLLAWAFHDSVHKIELALSAALRNFPIRPVGWLMWALIFPWGRRAEAPGDRLGHRVAALLMTPNEARDRLGQDVFLTPCENNPGGRIASYLTKAVLAEPVERKFLKALKSKKIQALDFTSQLDEAVREGMLTLDERHQLEELRDITMDTISVDDFDTNELRSASYSNRMSSGNDHSREAA
ncbi:acyl-CoA dehydrogenase [Xanthomonas albilineans]|uniref:Acyl-coenzyme A dehydrogenase n=1 Tax=Xanthomonas albilineans (strain GPE PC73 / CFBP 7063) TaxID=380358 RepID=D2UET4_XANAP|nr:acyl-CoA dehydrogenase [Xanthomonas albilineans]QHQ28926.1 putative acyl-coa dehydrogenase protein [Xanthomonas albilineans]CBA16680.1 putative acyl-coa dehydrogenase protein [Xanthomonas albilineans GPE PC73]